LPICDLYCVQKGLNFADFFIVFDGKFTMFFSFIIKKKIKVLNWYTCA